nr:Rap1a/Tai family immunity protein [uncultured Cohaesibacter sp.]
MKLKSMVIAAASCAIVSISEAENLDGNTLYELCYDQSEVSKLACSSYIRGAIEGMYWGTGVALWRLEVTKDSATTDELNDAQNLILMICQPPTATISQLVDISANYLRNHPESRPQGARTQIWKSLSEAFPCN